jgi:hypothetical protein
LRPRATTSYKTSQYISVVYHTLPDHRRGPCLTRTLRHYLKTARLCRVCTPLYCLRSRATTLHTPSQYISYSNIYTRSPVASLDLHTLYIYQSVQYLILRSALYISVCTVFDTTISLICIASDYPNTVRALSIQFIYKICSISQPYTQSALVTTPVYK